MNKNAKTTILNTLEKNWFTSIEGGDIFFYKHVEINKKNKILHIILSGTEYDGIYELFTIPSQFDGKVINNGNLVIKTKNNFDYALFKGKRPEGYIETSKCGVYGYCIIRGEYENEESFKKALLNTKLVSEEEYETYTYTETKKYVYNKTPKIEFVA